MLDRGRDSDSELSLEAVNSGYSSMSSDSCSSFSRLSFELIVPPSQSSPENNHLTLKPHRSSDSAYSAVRRTGLTFRDFRLIRRIGAGDIGTVYLCALRDCSEYEEDEEQICYYAMKVVDKEALAKKKKVQRAEMERKILKMLDHPFLPTLHAEFEASHFSCIVMEYCSGGDLHSLRHKLLHKRFSLNSARYFHHFPIHFYYFSYKLKRFPQRYYIKVKKKKFPKFVFTNIISFGFCMFDFLFSCAAMDK